MSRLNLRCLAASDAELSLLRPLLLSLLLLLLLLLLSVYEYLVLLFAELHGLLFSKISLVLRVLIERVVEAGLLEESMEEGLIDEGLGPGLSLLFLLHESVVLLLAQSLLRRLCR